MQLRSPFFALVLLGVAALAPLGAAEPTLPSIRIAAYHGDRVAALSYTFDDGLRDHYTLAAPMLEEFGFLGTFFIIGKVVAETDELAAAKKPGAHGAVSWAQIKDLAARGHEIGNHSWSHRQLVKCTPEELTEEIERNRTVLTEKLGVAPLTFCYPGNGSNEAVRAAVMKDHIAARERHFEIGQVTQTTADINTWADANIAKGGWGIAMIHGLTAGYHSLSSPEVLRQHFAYVKSEGSKLWVDTFANVARYVAGREAAKLTVRTLQPKSAVVVLDSTLRNPSDVVPLTIVIEAPGVRTAKAERNGQPLPASVREGRLLIDATPAPEEIRVTWE